MDARNVMLAWIPNTDDVRLFPHPWTSGKFPGEVVDGRHVKHYWTTLACSFDFKRMTFEQRKTIIFIEAMHLIVRDGCDPRAVHRALWPLAEYRGGLSPDVPAPDVERRTAR